MYKEAASRAMQVAWQAYGPKDVKRTIGLLYPTNPFQATDSEWDRHIIPSPTTYPPPVEPSFSSWLYLMMIDIQVNYPDTFNLVRTVIFGTLVGFVIVAWVLLGAYVGMVPMKWLGFAEKKVAKKVEYDESNDVVSNISEKIFLALDGNWLDRLKERVESSGGGRKWAKTSVECCLLPEAETQGMAECEVIRRGGKMSSFECLSHLIYKFSFGPDPTTTTVPSPTIENQVIEDSTEFS